MVIWLRRSALLLLGLLFTSGALAAADLAAQVAAHTSGLLSRHSEIHIRFQHDVVAAERVGQSAAAQLTVEPSIAGEPRFTSRRDIVWQPSKPLVGGQQYKFTVHGQGLAGMPDPVNDYSFVVETIAPDFEIVSEPLQPSASDSGSFELRGEIRTADREASAAVERVLVVRVQQQALPLKWQHTDDGLHHQFSALGIRRQAAPSSVEMFWNGQPIDVTEQGKRSIEVPARREFKVLDIQAVQGEQQYVRVSFSDEVDTRQNLNGLVTLSGADANVRVEGSAVKIYPAGTVTGELTVQVDGALRSVGGERLGTTASRAVVFASQLPQVRFVGKGVILPDNKKLTIPFEAINVRAVQVTAFRVYADNMGQFLQNNQLDGTTELERVGRYLWRKTIKLPEGKAEQWNRYAIDATELLTQEPGALFRLTLSFNRGDARIACNEADSAVPVVPEEAPRDFDSDQSVQYSSWEYAEDYYNGGNDGSTWQDRSNVCKDAYYRFGDGKVRDARNFIASNIGLIAKQDARGGWHVIATDLRTAEPMAGVGVELRSYQDQTLAQASTDAKGFANLSASTVAPFYLVASKGKQVGYLKLSPGVALPVSHFDVGGEKVTRGVKGAIYGERGVWRPGDDIYLTFVLQDKDNVIPPNHPVTMQLLDPQGQLVQSVTNAVPVGDFYTFKMSTAESAPTGNWSARALLGGQTFTLPLRIEAVIPNRLKVELEFGSENLRLEDGELHGQLFGQWLHGATAAGLNAEVSVRLAAQTTSFTRNTDFVFDDPARSYHGEPVTLFEGQLDDTGHAEFNAALAVEGAPGMLNATFTSKVFEPGGAFSTSRRSFPLHVYERYVGIRLPKGDAARGMLLTDTDHTVDIATVDADGKPVPAERVQVTLYKIEWRWWWDKTGDNLADYASGNAHNKLQESVVATPNGRGSWKFQVKYPDWGRYMVRACDLDSGHCTGKVVYIDWPGWAGRAVEQSGSGANMLTVYADKPRYTVGETAVIRLPEAQRGRALLTVESSRGILEQRWLVLDGKNNVVNLPLTAAMSPNVYVAVTLVQPHQGKTNDLPIRLYGVIPLEVNDPNTRLEPVLNAADEWTPRGEVGFDVKEATGRAMTYTVAVVDEGLLGLTNFDTPDLRKQFYRREALAVSTWDLFDQVVGAYGGELERLLALGGSDAGSAQEESAEKRRFPPVVQFLGPFHLDAGKSNHHEITLPQYLGAVRVMVVAGEQGAYGNAQKSIPVRDALSMLVTLPRVLRPGEEITVPVSLFAQRPDITSAEVQVLADERLEVVGDSRVQVAFAQPGEQLAFLRLKVKAAVGKARLRFAAKSGKYRTNSDVTIDVLPANAPTSKRMRQTLTPGQLWEQPVVPFGLDGTGRVLLEVSAVPPIDLDRRLRYLIQYPHGCVEQVTSSVFPQLYLPQLAQLSPEERAAVERNVNAGIDRLRGYQASDGGFRYWPGADSAADWATSYVGHFLLEAMRLGYHVPAEMLDGWKRYQVTAARNYVAGTRAPVMAQTYRLYTLALAKQPETGAMNRLRESPQLTGSARWMLASAYRVMGLAAAASEIASSSDTKVADSGHWDETYGSALRDRAIVLNALSILGRRGDADRLAQEMAQDLASESWYSTQATAFALNALANVYGASGVGSEVKYQYRIGVGPLNTVAIQKPIHQQLLADFPAGGEVLSVRNVNAQNLYATLTVEGIPPAGAEEAVASGLNLTVAYRDLQGNELDPARLPQGRQFVVVATIGNDGEREIKNLALTHLMPAGWEIHNARFDGEGTTAAPYDYQDVRDDRLLTYFGLKPRESRSFSTLVTATYLGRYYLPGVAVEAMYDNSRQARSVGQWVEIVKKAP